MQQPLFYIQRMTVGLVLFLFEGDADRREEQRDNADSAGNGRAAIDDDGCRGIGGIGRICGICRICRCGRFLQPSDLVAGVAGQILIV